MNFIISISIDIAINFFSGFLFFFSFLIVTEITGTKPTGRFGYKFLLTEPQINIRCLSINKYSGNHEIRFLPSRMFGTMAEWGFSIIHSGFTIMSAIEGQGAFTIFGKMVSLRYFRQ